MEVTREEKVEKNKAIWQLKKLRVAQLEKMARGEFDEGFKAEGSKIYLAGNPK